MNAFESLNRQIVRCQLCDRLTAHCREIASTKRKSFAADTYWGQPVPNFGPAPAGLLIVGLAPAAHGGNRTGRVFTGDRSGDWLFRALHKAGFANQPNATHRDDGLELFDCAITAVCHCAPPDNKPLPEEVANCRQWLVETIDVVQPKVLLALGQIAWRSVAMEARRRNWHQGGVPKFGHAAKVPLA